jgi:hypothetical protein
VICGGLVETVIVSVKLLPAKGEERNFLGENFPQIIAADEKSRRSIEKLLRVSRTKPFESSTPKLVYLKIKPIHFPFLQVAQAQALPQKSEN